MYSIATFNANNFFLRYKFSRNIPNSFSKDSEIEAGQVIGFLPGLSFRKYTKNFIIWDKTRRELAAKALKEPENKLPDILCFQEVENIEAIRLFNQMYLNGYYKYSMLIDSYDPRNIDVGILSTYPIQNVRSHIDDADPNDNFIFSRDCLEVEVDLGNERIYLFLNHLKSKLVKRKSSDTDAQYNDKVKASHEKRLKQAATVIEYIEDRFNGFHDTALYAVIGDFNDTPYSPWIKPLIDSPRLFNVLDEFLSYDDRWTYYWKSKNRVSQIDYFLVSEALRQRISNTVNNHPDRAPHIERQGIGYRKLNSTGTDTLPKETNYYAFENDDVTPVNNAAPVAKKQNFRFNRYQEVLDDPKNNISDHCPVKIWFD